MLKVVQTKPTRFEASFYDGSLDSFNLTKDWIKKNSGELYREEDVIRGTEKLWLYSRGRGTVELSQGMWIIKRTQGEFEIYTPEELNEQFDIL